MITRLTWKPPALDNPTTIQLTPTMTRILRLEAGKDYILQLPASEPLRIALVVIGGRNIHMIGGEIAPDAFVAGSVETAAVRFYDQTGDVFVEGVKMRGQITDGIHTKCKTARIFIQNCWTEILLKGDPDVSGSAHSDWFQSWGGVKEVYIDGWSGTTPYVALGIHPEYDTFTDLVDVRRVSVKGLPESRYHLWMTKENGVIRLTDVYLDIPPERFERFGSQALAKSVWPDKDAAPPNNATLHVDEATGREYVDWLTSVSPKIEGRAWRGLPDGGHFVDPAKVGIGYVSPGYVGDSEPPPPPPPPSQSGLTEAQVQAIVDARVAAKVAELMPALVEAARTQVVEEIKARIAAL